MFNIDFNTFKANFWPHLVNTQKIIEQKLICLNLSKKYPYANKSDSYYTKQYEETWYWRNWKHWVKYEDGNFSEYSTSDTYRYWLMTQEERDAWVKHQYDEKVAAFYNGMVHGTIRISKLSEQQGRKDRESFKDFDSEWGKDREPDNPVAAEIYQKIYKGAWDGLSVEQMIEAGTIVPREYHQRAIWSLRYYPEHLKNFENEPFIILIPWDDSKNPKSPAEIMEVMSTPERFEEFKEEVNTYQSPS
jgi:hypothetical protein